MTTINPNDVDRGAAPDVTEPVSGLDPVGDHRATEDTGLLPLLRRPAYCPPPVPLGQLRTTAAALMANPRVRLDEAAARVVTSGATDPAKLRALVRVSERGPDAGVDLLTDKAVTGGTLHVTGVHQRYTDDAILPDLRNGRWGHRVHPASDTAGAPRPVTYAGLPSSDGGPDPAVLVVHFADRAELAAAVRGSMAHTLDPKTAGGGSPPNDYTDSVIQQGVKEPMLLFLLRVHYADGNNETFLMSGDGNSRLVSTWKARTGGDIDAAATALVRNVLGGTGNRPRDPRRVRSAIVAMAERVNRGLGEGILTEQTIREGQTVTVPAVVVVGMTAERPDRRMDLVAAKDDLIASLHVHTTPWAPAARYDQGMAKVLRLATDAGLIADPAVADLLAGHCDVMAMSERLGLPPHPLWAAATWVEQATGANWAAMRPLFRQVFGLAQAQRKLVGERLGVVALAPFRSRDDTLGRAERCFADGGPLTDEVLDTPWHLTQGADTASVLDSVRDAALAGDVSARCELVVLGGIAAMLTGLLSRDRGSKEGTERDAHHTPYRKTPYRLLEQLAATEGGLRTLHSIAMAFVQADGRLPKQFQPDGQPVTDAVGAEVSIDYEWDLFAVADPEETAAAAERARNGGPRSGGGDGQPEDVRLRQAMADGLRSARRAVRNLSALAARGGNAVMGTSDFVDDCRRHAEAIRDELIRLAPVNRTLDFDDEDDVDGDVDPEGAA